MNYKWQKIFDSEEALMNNVPLYRATTILVFGRKVCLVHGSNGVFGMQDRCPHNGASLGRGACNEQNQIVCPMHRYPFDIATGKAMAGLSYTLETYPVKIQEDGVFVGMKRSWWEF